MPLHFQLEKVRIALVTNAFPGRVPAILGIKIHPERSRITLCIVRLGDGSSGAFLGEAFRAAEAGVRTRVNLTGLPEFQFTRPFSLLSCLMLSTLFRSNECPQSSLPAPIASFARLAAIAPFVRLAAIAPVVRLAAIAPVVRLAAIAPVARRFLFFLLLPSI